MKANDEIKQEDQMSIEKQKRGLKRKNLNLNDCVGELILPGDEFLKLPSTKTTLGPGLRIKHNQPDIIIADRPGILSRSKQAISTFFIEVKVRNYAPIKKDDIIGILSNKRAESYICDIGTRDRVELSKFAFEGATKKYRPNLKNGDVVFGRFIDKPRDMPPEITCVNPIGKSHGMGQLQGGFTFQVPIHFLQYLRNPQPKYNLISKLGKIVDFESVIGDNGFVWINAKSASTTLAISILIQQAAHENTGDFSKLLNEFRIYYSSI